MSWLKSWFKADYGDPAQRFAYVDGASYDGGPDGVYPIRRALRTPTLKATAIAGLFFAASVALFVNSNAKRPALLLLSAAFTYVHVLMHREDSKTRRKEYPSLRKVVIDKTGRTLSDPKALFYVSDYYQREVEAGPRFLALVPTLIVATWTGVNLAIGSPATNGAGAEAVVTALSIIPYASRFGWAAYARHQLQEKRWTLRADPPPLKKEATEPAQRGLLPAVVPARAPASPAPGSR